MKYEDLSTHLRKDIEGAKYGGHIKINDNISIEYDFSNEEGALFECPRIYVNGDIISYNALLENGVDIKNYYTESDGMEFRTDIIKLVAYNWELMKDNDIPSFDDVLAESENEDDFLDRIEKAVINAFDFKKFERYKVKGEEKSAKEVFEGFNQVVKNGNDFDKAKYALENNMLDVEEVNEVLKDTFFGKADYPVIGKFSVNDIDISFEYLINYNYDYIRCHNFGSWAEWLQYPADKISYEKFIRNGGVIVEDSSYLSEQIGYTEDNEVVTEHFAPSDIYKIFSVECIIRKSNTEEEFEKNMVSALADAYKQTYSKNISELFAKEGEKTVSDYILEEKEKVEIIESLKETFELNGDGVYDVKNFGSYNVNLSIDIVGDDCVIDVSVPVSQNVKGIKVNGERKLGVAECSVSSLSEELKKIAEGSIILLNKKGQRKILAKEFNKESLER